MGKQAAIERLLAITDERRIQLGMRWKDVYEAAGFAHNTLDRWRKGKRVDRLTDAAFSRVLQWDPGSRDQILNGGDPTPLEETHPSATLELFTDPREQAIWELPQLTRGEKLYLITALRHRDQRDQIEEAVEEEVKRRHAG